MNTQKTILASAYAINPYKGSEDGMGWNFVLQIARFNKVIAVTRENNRPNIEQYMYENPDKLYQNIQFLYYDLPYWMRFWKKGGRGAMLYYWMWQRGIVSFIKKQTLSFDIVHNLNFHNNWTPCYLWKLNKPFVWGPIGHHPAIPSQFLKVYKRHYLIKDRMNWTIKSAFWRFSFSLRKTASKANTILCMNSTAGKALKLPEHKQFIMPSVAMQDYDQLTLGSGDKFTLISAGRLVPLKGFDLTIRSFAEFVKKLPQEKRSKCELIIVGSGPEGDFYKRLCEEEGISAQVIFIDWLERSKLLQLYRRSTAFIFPSHEGAGMVVAEALSFGLPVICLKNSGPGEFINEQCGYAIKASTYEETVKKLALAIEDMHANPNNTLQMSINARVQFIKNFHWDRRGEKLKEIYKKLSA